MKRTPLWIITSIVVLLLASTLIWNFSMRAAGSAGRGKKGQVASGSTAGENFDIRSRETKEEISKFENLIEKLSSKQKERNTNFKMAMDGARGRKTRSAPGLKVTFCNLTNSPEVVVAGGGGHKFLTPPSSQPR